MGRNIASSRRRNNARLGAAPWAKSALLTGMMVLVCSTGCRTSQQTSIPNPFMTADRVPPPASRVPAAGTAQPYYPSDAMPPLPASQPAMQPLGSLPPSNDITPIAGDTYTQAAPSPAPRSGSPIPGESPMAFNEPAVQIPNDESTMRFAAVPQPTATASPTPPGAPPALAQQAPQPTPTVYREPQASPVTAPVVSSWPPVATAAPQVTLSPVSSEGNTSGLFREPNVSTQAPPPIQGSTAAPLPNSVPRIQVPGSDQRIYEPVVPGSVNTTSYQVGFSGGGPVATMQVPPPGYVPASFDAEQDIPTTSMSDGFRPRGSSSSQLGTTNSDASAASMSVTPG